MSNKKYLKKLLQATSASGFESEAAEIVQTKFKDTFGNAEIDEFFNVTSVYGEGSPVIYMSAHIDEIGLMVHSVEDDGFLGFCSIGGVDPRVLMAQEVQILTESGERLYGIIGAKPPHVLSPEDVKKAPKMSDLFIDTGLKAEDVKEKVNVGDMVTFIAPPIDLLNKKIASKSLDDRMGSVILLEAYKYIKKKDFKGKAVFCSSTQEEVGAKGAKVSAFRENPDIAIAIDVTHGKTPDSKDCESFDMDKVCIGLGPFCDRNIVELFKKASKKCKVEIELDVSGRWTGTDGDELQTVRSGVSMGVLEVPLKYMHTTVETLSYKTVKKAGKLLGEFLLMAGGAQ
jgi:endoglucanase